MWSFTLPYTSVTTRNSITKLYITILDYFSQSMQRFALISRKVCAEITPAAKALITE